MTPAVEVPARRGEVLLGQPREAYDASPRVNWSTLKHMARSPAHYASALRLPAPDKDAFRLGRATDSAILEPQRFAEEYVVWPKRRQGKDWDAFEAEAARAGKCVLSPKEHAEALAMRAAVEANPLAMRYLEGERQPSVYWTLEGDGWAFDCKGRFDVLGEAWITDLKTTRDASVRGFGRECAKYKYAAQSAFYSDGYFTATARPVPFYVVAVESSPPYAVTVFRLPESVIDAGRALYGSLLGKLHECRTRDEWSGYANSVVDLELPTWAQEETYE